MDSQLDVMQCNAELAALIGSRICHDLISPIGAIGNGIELMNMTDAGAMSPEMELVADSCRAAQARIRFFRVAFGSAGSSQNVSAQEAGKMLADFALGARQRPDWTVTDALPRCEVQLAFLAYLCFETAMPHGGRIRIANVDGIWHLQAEADRLSVDPGLWSSLTGTTNAGAVAPANVQFVLLPIVAADRGRPISVGHGETTLTLTV
ncbi:histidine phosphotransferase family protein [Roseivivax sp. CAU 1753]